MQNNNKEVIDIIFLGLAQNCEIFLPNFFSKIEEISNKKNIKVFIGENGSNDYTFDLIQKKVLSNKIYGFIDTTFIEKHNDRIKRLALARQALKDNLVKLQIKSKYVCVIDLDDVINESFNINLIEKLIFTLNDQSEKYFAVSLGSKPFYYDILNFESEEFPNQDIKKLQNNKNINSYEQRKEYIYKPQKLISKKKNFECVSGFNGLCLYLFEDYITAEYYEDNEDQTPEHLLFNRYLSKKLNKKILVTDNYFRMPKEHKPLNNIYQFMFEKIIKYLNIYFRKLID